MLLAVALPVLLGFAGLVVDAGAAYGEKRKLRNAADAAALAAAHDAKSAVEACADDPGCLAAFADDIAATVRTYVENNGGPSAACTDPGAPPDECHTHTWPYPDASQPANYARVAVNVRSELNGFFTGLLALGDGFFKPAARAVAGLTTITHPGDPGSPPSYECVHGEPPADYEPPSDAPEEACGMWIDGEEADATTKAVAFAKSTDCGTNVAAIQWAGTRTDLNAIATNGGIHAAGGGPKRAKYLGLGRKGEAGCELGIPSPLVVGKRNADGRCGFGAGYDGDECFELLQGRISPADGLCRMSGTGAPCRPVEYPIPPPPVPTVGNGCASTDTANIGSAAWKASHPPGVYCAPPGVPVLAIGATGVTFDGYAFFAPQIVVAASNMTLIPPSAAGGERPTLLSAYGPDPQPDQCYVANPVLGGVQSATRYVGLGESFDDGGSVAWSSPDNVQDNSNEASAAPGAQNATTQRLRARNLGFAVPPGATVTGIVVEVERRASNANRLRDSSIRLLKAGAESGGEKGSATSWPTSIAYATYGAGGDLWGATWTPAEVNDAGFGVSIKAIRTANQAVTGFVRRVRITVHYVAPEPCALVINGSDNTLQGDVFAEYGSIWIKGGAASTGGGEGFLESLKLLVSGNLANFLGNGPVLGGDAGEPVFVEGHWVYHEGDPGTDPWTEEVCCSLDE